MPRLGRGMEGGSGIVLRQMDPLEEANLFVKTAASMAKRAAARERAAAKERELKLEEHRAKQRAAETKEARNRAAIARCKALMKAKAEGKTLPPAAATKPKTTKPAAAAAAAPSLSSSSLSYSGGRSKLSAVFGRRVDLNSAEGRALKAAKPQSAAAVRAKEKAREDAVVARLIAQEEMVEQMKDVWEQACKTAYCESCKQMRTHVPKHCKKNNHRITWGSGIKRWFKCLSCSDRMTVINAQFPSRPCHKCGGSEWEAAPLYRGRH